MIRAVKFYCFEIVSWSLFHFSLRVLLLIVVVVVVVVVVAVDCRLVRVVVSTQIGADERPRLTKI